MKGIFSIPVALSLLFATTAPVHGAANKQATVSAPRHGSAADEAPLYIYTYAGNGIPGYSGDGGLAIDAQLSGPWGTVVDAAGNLLISDFRGNRIRRIDASSGIISTIAGDGAGAYSGDGGKADSAELNAPEGMLLDKAGNLYFADSNNNRIRRIDASTGIITTIAGNGSAGRSGDGGLAIHAELNLPASIALDAAGNLFIADYNNHLIRKVDVSGVITTIAGTGNPGYSGDGGPAVNAELWFPMGVALDADGNLYISDNHNNRIRRVDAGTSLISTIAGDGTPGTAGAGGPAQNAELYSPGELFFDSAGNLYLADTGNSLIREIEKSSGNILTLAGNGLNGYLGDGAPATSTALYFPSGMAFDAADQLYIADTNNARIRIVKPESSIATTTTLSANPSTLIAGQSLTLIANVVAQDGSIPTGPVVFINGTTSLGQASLSSTGQASLVLQPAVGNYSITARYPGSSLYAASASSPAIQIKVSAASPTNTSLTASPTALETGQQLTLTATVHSAAAPTPTGIVSFVNGTTVLGTAPLDASGVATLPLTPASGVYAVVASFPGDATHLGSQSSSVRVVVGAPPPSRNIYTFAGTGQFGYTGNGGPAVDAEFTNVGGLASDPSGNIYISDPQSNVVRRVDHATGIITAFAGNGVKTIAGDGGPALQASLQQMQKMTSDQDGNIYICDLFRVRMVNGKTGIITTVAGSGIGGYTTTPGPATTVELAFPVGVATDLAGNLFISDGANHVVWKVDAQTSYMHVIAGTGVVGHSGDGGPATSAQLYEPFDVATDAAGNLYIADSFNNRIRKVDAATGIIRTVAGTGAANNSGDGGLATNASIDTPDALAVDPAGNIYFSAAAYRIRRIDALTGFIYTVAGNGTYAYAGDGGPATSAEIGTGDDLTLDPAGNLYLSDQPPDSIRVRVVGAEPVDALIETTTSLAASASTLNAGQSLTLTATVSAASGKVPTGTVTFTNGSATLGTANLDASGTAQFTFNPPVGTYLIQASYSGSLTDAASSSADVKVSALADSTTTALTSSSTKLSYGQMLTLTATVKADAGGTPAGTVTFYNGSSILGASPLNGAGVATLAMTPAVGTYSITADYAGSGNDLSSSSAPPITVVVSAAPSDIALTVSPNPAPFGARVTMSATVSGGQTPATGTVTFYDGATAISTNTLASGAATFTTITLAVGSHKITAAYSGSAVLLAATSSPVTEIITNADFSMAVSPSTRTLYTGEAATFNIAINPKPGFTLDVALTCSGLPANTTCSFSPSAITGGSGKANLVIQTTAPGKSAIAALSADHTLSRRSKLAGAMGLALLLFPWVLRRRVRYLPVVLLPLMGIAALIVSAALTGCSTSSSLHGGTPPGTVSILITGKATNGAETLAHSVSVQLNVKSLF